MLSFFTASATPQTDSMRVRHSPVSYFYVTTPVCRIAVVFESRPFLLKRFHLFPDQETAADIPHAGPEVDVPVHARAKSILSCLDEFFAGRPVELPWELLSFKGLTQRQVNVLRAAARIPFGSVTTYGRLAETAGVPGAARFVGTALGRNPFPTLIPCHRVILKNGKTGGFSAGAGLKRKLIEFEQKVLSPQLPSSM